MARPEGLGQLEEKNSLGRVISVRLLPLLVPLLLVPPVVCFSDNAERAEPPLPVLCRSAKSSWTVYGVTREAKNEGVQGEECRALREG